MDFTKDQREVVTELKSMLDIVQKKLTLANGLTRTDLESHEDALKQAIHYLAGWIDLNHAMAAYRMHGKGQYHKCTDRLKLSGTCRGEYIKVDLGSGMPVLMDREVKHRVLKIIADCINEYDEMFINVSNIRRDIRDAELLYDVNLPYDLHVVKFKDVITYLKSLGYKPAKCRYRHNGRLDEFYIKPVDSGNYTDEWMHGVILEHLEGSNTEAMRKYYKKAPVVESPEYDWLA